MIFDKQLFAAVLFLYSVLCANADIVETPPKIIKQLSSPEVYVTLSNDGEGKPFFLECEAVAEPAVRYYWEKNGKPFDWQGNIDYISQLSGRGTLIFTNFNDSDEGQYQCFAENELGVASSNSVFVYKSELKSFEDMPIQTQTGNEGKPFKINCNSPSGKPKPEIHWVIEYTTNEIKAINKSRITVDPEGNLWFSNLTREDASDNFMYACSVTSAERFEYKLGNKVLLNVVLSRTLSTSPPVLQYVSRKNKIALREKIVELYCIFGGTPLPVTVWSKNGVPIEYSEHVTQQNYGKSLRIENVDFTDDGVYTCKVSNGVGEDKSHSINLIVLATPYFTEEPESINGSKNELVEISCIVDGVPEPKLEWIYNGKPIEETPSKRRTINGGKLTIANLKNADIGNYGCKATNYLGSVYKEVYVNID